MSRPDDLGLELAHISEMQRQENVRLTEQAEAPACIWVILYERSPGYSWTDLAFWGAATTYEAALEKLSKVIGPPNVIYGHQGDKDVRILRRGRTWRIRQVPL